MIDTLLILQTHGYWILFLLLLIEGGTTGYIGAFLASIGVFNIYIVFLLTVFGSVLMDFLIFQIGKVMRKDVADRMMRRFHLSQKHVNRIKAHLKKHLGKTLAVIKVTPFLPIPGMMLAGIVKTDTTRFVKNSVMLCIAYAVILCTAGFYSGLAFDSVLRYAHYGERIVVSLIVIGAFLLILKSVLKNIAGKIERI